MKTKDLGSSKTNNKTLMNKNTFTCFYYMYCCKLKAVINQTLSLKYLYISLFSFGMIQNRITDPEDLRSCKRTSESLTRVDSLANLMHHDLKDVICLHIQANDEPVAFVGAQESYWL